MEKLEIDGYQVRIVLNDFKVGMGQTTNAFYTAYVELPGSGMMDYWELDFPTYHNDDIIGIDTAHVFNMYMTLTEKYQDAIRQVKEVIAAYHRSIARNKGLQDHESEKRA